MSRTSERRRGRSDEERRNGRRDDTEQSEQNRGATVLVVGSPDERQMYAFYLRFSGFDAVTCRMDEAFQTAISLRPAAVIADNHYGGLDLVRRLRQDPRTTQSLIVIIGSRVFPADQNLAECAGCDVFLPKPCLPAALVTELQQALSNVKGRDSSPTPRTE